MSVRRRQYQIRIKFFSVPYKPVKLRVEHLKTFLINGEIIKKQRRLTEEDEERIDGDATESDPVAALRTPLMSSVVGRNPT